MLKFLDRGKKATKTIATMSNDEINAFVNDLTRRTKRLCAKPQPPMELNHENPGNHVDLVPGHTGQQAESI